jgi:hypothetical protein
MGQTGRRGVCLSSLARFHRVYPHRANASSPWTQRFGKAQQICDRLTRARAEGELNLVTKLEADPDSRAAAFLLERGYRERWGKEEPQQRSPTITLSDEQMTALLEGLRYCRRVRSPRALPPK